MVKKDSPVMLHSPALRRFTKHLINATVRQNTRNEKIKHLGDQIDVDMIMGHARHKEHVLEDISVLKDKINLLSVGERSLEAQQSHEFQKVDVMEQRLQAVDEKIDALSHIAFMHAKINREEIEGLKQKTSNDSFRREDIKEIETLSEVTAEDEQKVRDILKEKKETSSQAPTKTKIMKLIAQKKKPHFVNESPILKVSVKPAAVKVKQEGINKGRSDQIKPIVKKIKKGDIIQIEKQIRNAEKMHKQLQKQGHPKVHLDSLKKMIDSHKKKLKELKK